MNCPHSVRERTYSGDECPACVAADRDKLRESLKGAELQIDELRRKAVRLDAFSLRVISDRGCVCNEADHRCATNQLYEDLEKLHETQDPRTSGVEGHGEPGLAELELDLQKIKRQKQESDRRFEELEKRTKALIERVRRNNPPEGGSPPDANGS